MPMAAPMLFQEALLPREEPKRAWTAAVAGEGSAAAAGREVWAVWEGAWGAEGAAAMAVVAAAGTAVDGTEAAAMAASDGIVVRGIGRVSDPLGVSIHTGFEVFSTEERAMRRISRVVGIVALAVVFVGAAGAQERQKGRGG